MCLSLYNKVAVCNHFFRVFWCANLLYTKVSHTVFLLKSYKVVYNFLTSKNSEKMKIPIDFC